ncbi:MAG: hypothetical protein VR74_05260 [Hyphomonas sp. BRH_c22]|uniref:hypothetical protein n=1 Tax=Hyphomonas sp. BRH_c22 TaxID=1629710 RepID=UPI0005F0DB66|nr:hypothetical protein [Hyphomonas sp. BRH_c22]KJS38579.1 MAG: hypothetical protein VR74_05260 [Hyphomonas sp. BRH_c22]
MNLIATAAPLFSTDLSDWTVTVIAGGALGFCVREILGAIIVGFWHYLTRPFLRRLSSYRNRQIRIRDLQQKQIQLAQEVQQLRQLAERLISQRDDYIQRWIRAQQSIASHTRRLPAGAGQDVAPGAEADEQAQTAAIDSTSDEYLRSIHFISTKSNNL